MLSKIASTMTSDSFRAPWVRFAFGAGFDRDTESYAAAAGLAVSAKRWLFRDIIKLLVLKPRR